MFQFKLQKILDFKQAVENDKKLQLGEAYRAREQEKRKLFQYQQQKERQQLFIKGEVDVIFMLQRQQFLTAMDEKIMLQRENLARAEKMIKKKRAELTDAIQERKVFARIKERQREQYNYQAGVKEQKILDETATISFIRKKS